MFQCKVCQEYFSSGWDHVLLFRTKFPFSEVKDNQHQEALDKASEDNYEHPCPFCDGRIVFNGTKDSYEVVCEQCGYLFEED